MKKLAAMALTVPLLLSFAAGAFAKAKFDDDSGNLGVYYEIYVNAFRDSDNDGKGDLNGLTQKLDYLNDGNRRTSTDLEVDALWLMPVTASPSYHKYDTTDYYSIDPQYGTLEDFRRLTEEADTRGMNVILDLAVNHTSNQHPWFQEAVRDKNSKYRDYYVWADESTDINEKGPWGQQLWYETYPGSGDYYYALFADFMPDLNFDNPEVRKEMINVGKFWLKQGADGFRLDAAMHIFGEQEVDKNVAWWDEFKQGLQEVKKDVYLVGEVWDRPEKIAPYYKALDSLFNFDLSGKLLESVRSGKDNGLAAFSRQILEQYEAYGSNPIDAQFLTNHDQERTMSVLGGDVNKAKMAASILLTLPGNPFMYYGEEIGMLGKNPHEYIREPFRWYPEGGEGQTFWEAPRDNVGPNAVSVETQTNDPDSLLSRYREMIRIRHDSEALMKGGIEEVQTGDDKVIGYKRTYKNDSVLVLHNLSGEEATVKLDRDDFKGRKLEFATSDYVKVAKTREGVEVTIPAYTSAGLK